MIKKYLAFRKSSAYDIIRTVRNGIAKAGVAIASAGFVGLTQAVRGIIDLRKRRRDMKINMITKEELADLIDVAKLKELTETLSGVEKYIPTASSIAAMNPFAKKEEVVVVEKKSSPWKIIVGVIVGLAAFGAIGFAIYKYFCDDYDDDFLDDIDDEFEDDEDEELFED